MDAIAWSVLAARQDVGQSESSSFQYRSNTTSQLVNELQFEAAKSVRTSIVTFSSFNVFAAVVTVVCILRDCYQRARRDNSSFTFKSLRPSLVGSAEVFPLVLSCGIIAQGIIFAVVQSKGLKALMILDCMPLSQAVMPALFTTPYIQLIFGFEIAIRAMFRTPFPKRWTWAVPICLAITLLGLVGTYLVTLSIRPPNFCYATLFFLVKQWNIVTFALLTSITGALVIISLLVIVRLRSASATSIVERESASQMAWYLVAAVMLNTLMLPFFFIVTFINQDQESASTELSMIASVAANMTGLVTGGLYLYFRSRRVAMEFKEAGKRRDAEIEKKFQSWGSRNSLWSRGLGDTEQLAAPEPPRSPSVYSHHSYDNDASVYQDKEEQRVAPSSGQTPALTDAEPFAGFNAAAAPLPPSLVPSPLRTPKVKTRQPSYAIFPPKTQSFQYGTLLPATTYNPNNAESPVDPSTWDALEPPSHTMFDHRRGSSVGTSATVQIGLRFSHMDDVENLKPAPLETERQSFMGGLTSRFSHLIGPAKWTKTASKLTTISSMTQSTQRSLDKELPHTPDNGSASPVETEMTLSPTVYSPPTKDKAVSPEPEVNITRTRALTGSSMRIPGFAPLEQKAGQDAWI